MDMRRVVPCVTFLVGVSLAGGVEVAQRVEEPRQEQGRFVPSAEIVGALANPARDTRGRPRIDLHINFEFDSARLTRDGREQAEQLGEALLTIVDDEGAAGWLLVGHTDARGARSYNQALSVRRARALRAYLIDDFGFDARDIDVDGKGEDELLDPETTEAAHSVNRRVEVVRRR